jgi:CrcB protein
MPLNFGVGVIALLGLAGGLGAATRCAFAEWATKRWQASFPLATLLINVTGAFALGLLTTAAWLVASPVRRLRTLADAA